jgi:hypothetical protein
LQATRTEERKFMRQITKNVIIEIREKRMGWITS